MDFNGEARPNFHHVAWLKEVALPQDVSSWESQPLPLSGDLCPSTEPGACRQRPPSARSAHEYWPAVRNGL